MESTVVGYDRSPSSERALFEAGREAAWRNASVTVVHAFHWIPTAAPMTYTPARVEESLEAAAAEVADAGADLLRSRYPGMAVEAVAVAGAPFEILTYAARDADLLVVGNRGRGGFASMLLGSVSLRTLTHTPCPAMVVRGTERAPRDVVVVAVDPEDPGDAMLNFAFAEAERRSARLRAVSAWDMSWTRAYVGDTPEVRKASAQAVTDAETKLDRVLYPWRAQYPEVRVAPEVVDGAPSAVLTQAAAQADLIIAGAHRRDDDRPGVRLGPTAQVLLHHADCPVVVVPRG